MTVPSMHASSSSPLPPIASGLGWLALVPFVAGALGTWVAGDSARPLVAQALSAYAATVVAFIGALHWGFAFARARVPRGTFVWGVLPAIVAWIAVLSRPGIGLVVHAVTLALCYAVDRATYPAYGVGAWLPFRWRLSIVAIACCLVGAAGGAVGASR